MAARHITDGTAMISRRRLTRAWLLTWVTLALMLAIAPSRPAALEPESSAMTEESRSQVNPDARSEVAARVGDIDAAGATADHGMIDNNTQRVLTRPAGIPDGLSTNLWWMCVGNTCFVCDGLRCRIGYY